MGRKISIFKELNLKDYTFNLKSETTGKYSVHESYRDNFANGFLGKINAPADVNNALKDIYYATEKGLCQANPIKQLKLNLNMRKLTIAGACQSFLLAIKMVHAQTWIMQENGGTVLLIP